jgi:hypothetical protein
MDFRSEKLLPVRRLLAAAQRSGVPREGAALRKGSASRHRVGQLLRRIWRGGPVRRLQGERPGRELGEAALENYTESKTVTVSLS